MQLTVIVFCIYWQWHVPMPNKAVLLLGGVAAIMALVKMLPIHKALYIILIIWLMFTENRALNHDRTEFARDEAARRKEENKNFSNIGDSISRNVQALLDHSNEQFRTTVRQQQAQFSTTMHKFSAVSKVQHEQLSVENEILKQPPSLMPCNQLASYASEVAKRMRAFQKWYELADRNIDLPIYNEMGMSGTTEAHRKELQEEEDKEESALRVSMEQSAKPLIAEANQFRVAMIEHLVPDYARPEEDGKKKSWFENPVSTNVSFLYQLQENADYLDALAQRTTLSCEEP